MLVSNILYVHPFLIRWSNLTNIFQLGWNHQLDMIVYNCIYIYVWYWNSCLSTSANVCPTLLQECTVKAHPEGPILAFLGFVIYIYNYIYTSFCWTKYAMVNVQTWNMWTSILSHGQLLQITSLQMVQERLFQSRQDFPNKGEGSAVW